jgi:nucleoside-diphosphate-sugar epimerase
MFSENLNITLKHLLMLEKNGFSGHYIYVSTDRALLPSHGNAFVNEVKISNDPYGACKLFSEMITAYGCNLKNIKSSNLRFPNLYGKGQTSQQLLPMILDKIHSGERQIVLNSMSGDRNYLHISDAVSAVLKFLKNPIQHQNICISGANVELREICEALCDIYQNEKGESLEFFESAKPSARSTYLGPPKVLSDDFFRSVYGWRPKTNIRDGLMQLIIDGE